MEHTRPIVTKRSQPCALTGVSSLTQQSTLFFAGDPLQQLPFEFEAPFELGGPLYGNTSGLELYASSHFDEAPAKRRKIDTFSNAMPQRHVSRQLQNTAMEHSNISHYNYDINGEQSFFVRWAADNGAPQSNSLAQLPRRMAELMCGPCGIHGDRPDGYFNLPQAQPNFYDPSKPYSAEKQPVMEAQVIPESTPHLDLTNYTTASNVEGAGMHHNQQFPTFVNDNQLQDMAEFIPNNLLGPQHATFSELFASGLVKEEQDLVTSPTFGQENLLQSTMPLIDFDVEGFNELQPPLQHINMMVSPGAESALLMAEGNFVNLTPTEPWLNDNTSTQASNFDILLPNQRGGKRGPFRDPNLREQTAQTRKIGSCIRCRMQRIRCENNPEEPGGACLTCKKVSNAKAGRFPCLRYKITDIKLYKPGQVPGYEWTRRWNNNISDPIQKWASSDVKFVRISAGYSRKCIQLKVRQFVPQDGDKLERTWDFRGTKKSVKIPPYALMDLEDGKSAYTKHIYDVMSDTLQHVTGRSTWLFRRTYSEAFRIYQDPSIPDDWKQLFDWTFKLWVSIRLSTTSGFIVGDEKLGMSDNILDSTSPNSGKIPVPPVLGAQLDLVLIHHIQTRLRRELLDKLQKMVLKNKQNTWFVTYLVTFILLHNAALITAHDGAYARKHGIKRRFAREDKVKEYQLGANILLAHFHYCNKGWYPFSDDCKDQDLRALADLDDDKIRFVHETRSFVREHQQRWERLREQRVWEDDYFFVSQLYEENWHPRAMP